MLTTRVRPTAGEAAVAGVDVARDPVRARAQFAVVPQRSNLDRALSIRRNLTFHASYHGVPAAEAARRADTLLEQFGLSDRGNVKPDLFSGGQAQRVMIARALMHEPQVLFLDEPTTGLDPAARLFVWDRLKELRDRGVTLFLTTHDMHEATTLTDRVGIMDHGRLLALDSPQALTEALPGSSTLELSTVPDGESPQRLIEALRALDGVERAESLHDETQNGGAAEQLRIRLYVAGDAPELVAPVATLLAERGLRLTGVELGTPSLEDVFIHHTGRALR
jgi:ABC-2 type transport system ATP-binding protein